MTDCEQFDADNRARIAAMAADTHEQVLRELELYSPLVRKGRYVIVMDTVVADLPAELFPDRPWRPGDSPRTAVQGS